VSQPTDVERRWRRYPTYKDSGVSWLGEIPIGWRAIRLKYVVSRIGSGKTPKGGGEVYSSSGIVFIRSQNIHFNQLRLDDVVYISEELDRDMASTRVLPNDVLLNITGASLGRCSLAPVDVPPANVNQHVCILRPRRNWILPGFLNACIASRTVQTQIFSSENGVSREGLNYTQTANLTFALPQDLKEQAQILSFVDRETAKTDSLIARKERLTELLQEKRTALITRAVTRGLDPSVPVKDTGIEWMAKIPVHWQTRRAKFLFRQSALPVREGDGVVTAFRMDR
jgi:type I restriction enzyme S subunit